MAGDKKKHVLIIEDDNFLAEIYKAKFEMEDFKVIVASDGKQGLDDARHKRPNVVLLDILLPKKDGFTVLHELKRDKKTGHIPVILLSNLGQKEDVEKGVKLGADEYLIKAHFTPSEVIGKVKEVINKKSKNK